MQRLAEALGQTLIVVNMSQQSDMSDLLGGFRPVDVRVLAAPMKERFESVFTQVRCSLIFMISFSPFLSLRPPPFTAPLCSSLLSPCLSFAVTICVYRSLGGFRPVDVRVLAAPLKERFESVFTQVR